MEGHKEDPRAIEGGRHTPQSIVGHLTPARVSAGPLQPPTRPAPFLSNENTGVSQQLQAGTNANTAFCKNTGAAPPVTIHLRLKGGYGIKSNTRLYSNSSYHDVVTLHLRLLIGQFVVLHFETLGREKANNYNHS